MANAKQPRSSSGGASVRLLDRRGGDGPLLEISATHNHTKSPKPRRSGKNRPAKNTLKNSPPPIPPPPVPPVAVEDANVLLQRVATWENLLKSHSGDKEGLASAWMALHRAYADLINTYPKTAQKLRVGERLWKSWYGEIGRLQTQNNPSGKSALGELLSSCLTFYIRLTEQLQGSLRRPNRSPDHQEGLKDALQMSFVALGDVARYMEAGNEPCDWTEARKYYRQALSVAPSTGKVYNQLGLLALREHNVLKGAYLYARSLACEKPFNSSRNLVHVLQPARSEQTNDAPSKAMTSYSTLIRSCLNKLLSGADGGPDWLKNLERIQAALDQLLEDCDPQSDGAPVPDTLSTVLLQVVCLIIISVHNTKSTIGNADRRAYDEAFKTGADNSKATLDALALGNITLKCVVAKLVHVLEESAETLRGKQLVNSLLPAVNVYLDWLHSHPVLLDYPAATAFRSDCGRLFRTLSSKGFIERGFCCAKSRDGDLFAVVLPEDRELCGFLPFEKVRENRFPGSENCKPEKLTAEELLVVRTTRFMTLSEIFVLPGQSTRTLSGPCLRNSGSHIPAKRVSTLVGPSEPQATSDPFAIAPVFTGRLCVSCSNTSTFADGECEFCGYDDGEETLFEDRDDYCLSAQENARQRPENVFGANTFTPQISPPSPASSPQSETSSSPPDNVGTDFKTIMSIGAEHSEYQDGLEADKCQQRLIVIDAPNVAMRHGKGKKFSCGGIDLAVKYFQTLGHRVVAFIPDYMLQSDEARDQHEEEGGTITAAKIPDDVSMLERMVHEGVLIPTPSQDYDDSYSIQYAGLHDGCVVTNDLFRDHIENMAGPRERKIAMRAWLRAHQISYSWVRDEFLPNPNFRFPGATTANTF